MQLTKTLRDVLQLLLQREVIEAFADSKLTINTLLRDVEPLHVEETILANSLDQRLSELLLPLGSVEQTQIDGDEICPVEVFLCTIRIVNMSILW